MIILGTLQSFLLLVERLLVASEFLLSWRSDTDSCNKVCLCAKKTLSALKMSGRYFSTLFYSLFLFLGSPKKENKQHFLIKYYRKYC